VSAETQAIMQMIEQIALNPQADVEKLRAVMDMKMQMFNRGAEIEFNAAMSLTQAEIEPVSRTAQNKQTNSKYAKLENIIKECSPIWTRHGFALSYDTADCPLPDHYRVTCEVSHRAGHSKNYHMDLPIDNAGINGTKNKTGMHGAGSTISYGRRYIACNVFNIAITDEDTDGAARNQRQAEQPKKQPQPISDSRLAAAIQKISTGEATIGRLLNNHTLTDSQKKVVKAQFPQVEL
jgi:hypothetical protein